MNNTLNKAITFCDIKGKYEEFQVRYVRHREDKSINDSCVVTLIELGLWEEFQNRDIVDKIENALYEIESDHLKSLLNECKATIIALRKEIQST